MDSNGPTRQSIGVRVRMARQQAALRQEDIARHLGIPRPSVSEIENGRRELTSVELTRLAALVGKPLAWFVAGDEAFDAKA
jgi:transcriptional regulator with XRE-family HTH domain